MANETGSIKYGPYRTMTFTDGQNYRVTIPTPPGARAVDAGDADSHQYGKPVTVTGMSAEPLRQWSISSPTANSVNNPASPNGTPNDATPGSGLQVTPQLFRPLQVK